MILNNKGIVDKHKYTNKISIIDESRVQKFNKINIPFKKLFLKFLFPLFPVKLVSSIFLITFLGILVAIRIIIGQFSIQIPIFGLAISFGWLPVYICGFFYGPIIGLFFGAACDSIAFVLGGGGLWFWLYAIQEPLVGFVSGIFGSIFFLKRICSLKVQIIIQKIIIYFFICFTIILVIYQFYLTDNKFSTGGLTNLETFVVIAIVSMILYAFINEIQSFLLYKKARKFNNYEWFSLYLFISVLVIFNTVLWSFIMGPITFVEYTKLISGHKPNNFIQYGAMYYLVPRVLKESIKTPLYIIVLSGITFALRTPMAQYIGITAKRW